MSETFTSSQHWLAIETSTDVLSLAVMRGSQVWAYQGQGAAKSSPDALPEIQALMQQAQLRFDQLDAVVFARGPGAFTGLRTACSLAQGLALGANIPVLPVDTLMAVAQEVRRQQANTTRVLAVLDARMDQVYSAAYEWQNGGWREVQAVRVHAPQELTYPKDWGTDFVFAGNVQAIETHRWPDGLTQTLQALPNATALCQLAPYLSAQGACVDAALALPLYVRDKVAQTTAEREQQKISGAAR